MNKAQWKAIYDFCKDNGYYDPSEVLQTLKAMGVIGSRDGFPDLARYPKNGTYEAMIDFLNENLNQEGDMTDKLTTKQKWDIVKA